MDRKMGDICNSACCTGCGCCKNVCPVHAITMVEMKAGEIHPYIDAEKCIGCGQCEKWCPVNCETVLVAPSTYIAAQSKITAVLKESASGGFVSAAYEYFCQNNGYVVGVENAENTFVYSVSNIVQDLKKYRNSKYVQSDTNTVYMQIGEHLLQKHKVMFVGLPCHVAGIKSYLNAKHISEECLLTIDLVCHGVVPKKLFTEYLEKRTKKKAEVSFRDPEYGTMKFILSIKEDGKEIYKSGVHRHDIYQEGYHGGVFYRESCYGCRYATRTRIGDISVSDFHGYGRLQNGKLSGKKTCVMLNTEKGNAFFKELSVKNYIEWEERPMEEAVRYNGQLNRPVRSSPERQKYLELISNGDSLYSAARKSLFMRCMQNEIRYVTHYDKIWAFFSDCIPVTMKTKIKEYLKRV